MGLSWTGPRGGACCERGVSGRLSERCTHDSHVFSCKVWAARGKLPGSVCSCGGPKVKQRQGGTESVSGSPRVKGNEGSRAKRGTSVTKLVISCVKQVKQELI